MKTHRTIIKKLNQLDQQMTIGMFKKLTDEVTDLKKRVKELEQTKELEYQADMELAKSYGGTVWVKLVNGHMKNL